MLKETYTELIRFYTDNESFICELWSEIEYQHSTSKRHYHNLNHLENILIQLKEVKSEIQNWNVILFTLFYHDIVYNSLKTNNEEKSSQFAEKRMKEIKVPAFEIECCKKQILATKSHLISEENDTNYFLDADISILGQDWDTYSAYLKNVRKEYSIYPEFIYNKGRKKVLNMFLEMNHIYKTKYFYNKYDINAKNNVQKEIQLLE